MMKKILNILIALVAVVSVTGCGKKENLTVDTFTTKMEEKGYFMSHDAVQELTGVTSSVSALAPDMMYSIEFYEASDDNGAKTIYDEVKGKLSANKQSSDVETLEEKSNYNKFTLTTADSYKVASRIGNTVIYINAIVDKKDEIVSLLTEINY